MPGVSAARSSHLHQSNLPSSPLSWSPIRNRTHPFGRLSRRSEKIHARRKRDQALGGTEGIERNDRGNLPHDCGNMFFYVAGVTLRTRAGSEFIRREVRNLTNFCRTRVW